MRFDPIVNCATSHYSGPTLLSRSQVSPRIRSIIKNIIHNTELVVYVGGAGKPLAVNMMEDQNRLGRAQLVSQINTPFPLFDHSLTDWIVRIVPGFNRIRLRNSTLHYQSQYSAHVLSHIPDAIDEDWRLCPWWTNPCLVDSHRVHDHLPMHSHRQGLETLHGRGEVHR